MAEKKIYNVYKGLQKPLMFKGFKGKFIAWGVGSLVGAVVLGGLIGSLVNAFLGGVAMVVALVVGFLATSMSQKNGLHNKTVNKGIFIISTVYKHAKEKRI